MSSRGLFHLSDYQENDGKEKQSGGVSTIGTICRMG